MEKIRDFLISTKALASPLSAFFIGTLLTCCASALLSSDIALQLGEKNVSTFYSGIILSVYYVAYIFATLFSYKTINKVGHIRAFSAYVSILSALVLCHGIYFSPIYWGILRFLEGYCLASAFICLESWLNTRSTNKNRGMIMSFYMITSYLGAAFGQLLLNIPDEQNFILLVVISIIFSIALVPVSLTALPSPNVEKHKSMSLKEIYKISPVGVMCCGISGVLVGGIYTLGVLYAQQTGLDTKKISMFMFFCIIGGMSAQFPLGRISDYFDRRFVMMWVAGFLFLISPWIHWFIDKSVYELAISAFLLGIGSFVLYPISVSHINDLINDEERTEASGILIMVQSIGMIIGPVVISYLMQQFGPLSFLVSFSVACGFFVLFAFKHISFKPYIKYTSITKTDPMPIAPSHIYPEITKNDSLSFIGKLKRILNANRSHPADKA